MLDIISGVPNILFFTVSFYPDLNKKKTSSTVIKYKSLSECDFAGLRSPVGRQMACKSEVLGSIPGLATYFFSPSADSRGAVVSYWQTYVHKVLVNRLGGLSLPRKSVVRLTDCPDITLDVYRGRTTKHNNNKGSSALYG